MSKLQKLCLLFGIFAISHGSESEEFATFIEGIIDTWKLRSPTIIVKDDLPKICMSKNHQWLLCLSNDQDGNELADHLASIHQHNKQDGLIFVGSQGHEKLLKHLPEGALSIVGKLLAKGLQVGDSSGHTFLLWELSYMRSSCSGWGA